MKYDYEERRSTPMDGTLKLYLLKFSRRNPLKLQKSSVSV